MRDIALTEWEHQPYVLNVLTSREMGAWLGRRDSRLLQEIRQEIADAKLPNDDEICKANNYGLNTALVIIDKYIAERSEE